MGKRYPGVTTLGGGRYRIRTEVRHPKTGRVHELDRRVKARSAAEAARRLSSVRAEWFAKHGRNAAAAGPRRLGEALDAWLDDKRASVRPSTASTYATVVAWWRAILGDFYLAELEPADIRGVLLGAGAEGMKSETIDGRLRVLRTFAREERVGHIVEGVSVKRDVRDEERQEDEGRGLSLEELRAFLAAGPTARLTGAGVPPKWWPRAWALVCAMAWTGMRFGEASALEWHDVDLEVGTIRIRRAQWRGHLGHTKARASKRTIVIPEELGLTLAEHRRTMLVDQLPGVDLALVFPSRRTGATYVSNTQPRKTILRVCDVAGIDLDDRPVVHCLRHTFNNLVRQNADELVRRALVGHADEAIGERYSAVTLEERRAAVGKVVQMVRGEG